MSTMLAALKNSTRLTRPLARNTGPAVGIASRYSSTMHDNDPEVLAREKERNLSKKQSATSTPIPHTAPGWNESLASASEAAVKADKHTGTLNEMQEHTVKYVKDRHHGTDSASPLNEPGVSTHTMVHNGSAVPEAAYTRDEIEGPLKDAQSTIAETTTEHTEEVITRKHVV